MNNDINNNMDNNINNNINNNDVISNHKFHVERSSDFPVDNKGMTALILTFIPIALLAFLWLLSVIYTNKGEEDVGGWIYMIYCFTVGPFIFIASIISSLVALKSKNKIPSIVCLIIDGLIIAFILLLFVR